jgi:hypothetical protein
LLKISSFLFEHLGVSTFVLGLVRQPQDIIPQAVGGAILETGGCPGLKVSFHCRWVSSRRRINVIRYHVAAIRFSIERT